MTRKRYERMNGIWSKATHGLLGAIAGTLGASYPQLEVMQKGEKYLPNRTAVRENFVVLTLDKALAAKVMSDDLEAALARWFLSPHLSDEAKNTLVVDFGYPTIQVRISVLVHDLETMEQMVEIGSALAVGYQKDGTRSPLPAAHLPTLR
ncbi:MAG: hypothetical protein H7Z41_17790 [Cytophagales bacterium]|nr:hypothetical protein [Armatimonadota bacterium]